MDNEEELQRVVMEIPAYQNFLNVFKDKMRQIQECSNQITELLEILLEQLESPPREE